MRKFIVVATIISLGFLLAPKLIGSKAHDMYLQGFDHAPMDKTVITIEHRSYTSSWFSSEAVTVMHFAFNTSKGDAFALVMTSKIHHGPVMLTESGVKFGLANIYTTTQLIGLPPKFQDFVDEYMGESLLTMESLIDFSVLSHDQISVPSLTYENDKFMATFGGLEVVGTSLLDYAMMKGKMKWPESSIKMTKGSVEIAEGYGSYDMYKYTDSMMLGKADITLPLLQMTGDKGTFSFENISVATDSTERNANLDIVQHIRIEKITAPIPVTAFQYDIELNQVNPQAIQKWKEMSQNIQLKTGNNKPAIDDKALYPVIESLLQEGLELNQYLKLDGMGGSLSIDWDMLYVGLDGGKSPMDVEDKKELLKAVAMTLLVEIDASIIAVTPFSAMISPYVQQGFIAERGNKLVVDIKLADATLTINGQPLPIEMLYSLLGKKTAATAAVTP